jgi:hypothetical protein
MPMFGVLSQVKDPHGRPQLVSPAWQAARLMERTYRT